MEQPIGNNPVTSGTNFEAYLENWDPKWREVLKGLKMHDGMQIDIAFAKFNGEEPPELKEMIDAIRAKAKNDGAHVYVKLAFGGATYPLLLKNEADAKLAADNVKKVVEKYGLDGIDLDIEPIKSDPTLIADFIKDVRQNLGDDKIIALTLITQHWNDADYKTIVSSVKNTVNYFQFMEYNLTVTPPNTFVDQIKSDIKTWMEKFDLSPQQVHLGLMPGMDDFNQFISPQDVKDLSEWARNLNLGGVMIWDLERDFLGAAGPPPNTGSPPFTFTNTIENALYGTK